MNPIVHAELSWLLSQGLTSRRDRVLVTCAGLAPDLDGLTLLGGLGPYAEYHHVLAHGLVAAAFVTLICLASARSKLATTSLGVVAFHLHLLCDLAGSGPGWPIHYYWPISMHEWFWDGQWDLASWQNSVIGLALTLAGLGIALVLRRTPVELLSVRWDQRVTQTIRTRFLGEHPVPRSEL